MSKATPRMRDQTEIRLIVNTRATGYKNQDFTNVYVVYHYETKPVDECWQDLFGKTYEAIVFDEVRIDGLDTLAENFQNEGCSKADSLKYTTSHIEDQCREFLLGRMPNNIVREAASNV